MIEPLLCGIVLGLVPITLLGLFVSAWNQYRRGSGYWTLIKNVNLVCPYSLTSIVSHKSLF